MKTYYCVTYTKYFETKKITNVFMLGTVNAEDEPVMTVIERSEYAVYHKWYSDKQYAYDYINDLRKMSIRL